MSCAILKFNVFKFPILKSSLELKFIVFIFLVNLLLYNVHAVTEGTDAQATVSVRIEEQGKTTVGQAADTDTLVASANAYLNALNKLIIKRTKTAPDQTISAQN